jgi:hypothetical protein
VIPNLAVVIPGHHLVRPRVYYMMVKIAFPLDADAAATVENMHAKGLPSGNFILDNIPFHAYGISWGDEFTATTDTGRFEFEKVVRRGGHSTYRVRLPTGATHKDFLKYWPRIEAFGCSYEGSDLDRKRLYAIDVPPGADVHALYRILEEGEESGQWEFEEAHYQPDGPGSPDPHA